MGFAVLRHAKIDGFQWGIIILTQVQEVLWLDIPNEDIAGMTLCHCPQNLTHRLGSICNATTLIQMLHWPLPAAPWMLTRQKTHEG